MISRQPKIHVGLRVIASGCIVLWLLASSFCSIEHLFGDDHHHAEANASATVAHHDSDRSQESQAAEHGHGEANHPLDSEQSSHDLHPHDNSDDACCSSLVATAQFAAPFVIVKPLLQPLDFLCPALQACDLMLSAPKDELARRVKPRDWVFTPRVCLDSAHRSLAASYSHLIESVAHIRARLVQPFGYLRVVGTCRVFSPKSTSGETTAINGRKQRDQEIQSAVTATKKETKQ